jgi:peroxiredoxin
MSTYPTTARVAVGDEAPNFDLTSTEGVVLMLRDEVPRTAVVLYVFADPASEGARRDLASLAAQTAALQRLRAKVLAMSPAPLAALQAAQRELGLDFPLLHDDRGFAAAYGVAAAAAEGASAPALALVGRDQRLLWLAHPAPPATEALPEILKLLRAQPSPTALYPRSVVNRLVDRWVN